MRRFSGASVLPLVLVLGGLASARATTTTTPPATTTTVAVCGNGIREGTEQCDDGNPLDGDCCSTACAFEASGLPCLEDEPCYVAAKARCDGAGTCAPDLLACGGTRGMARFKLVDVPSPGRDAIGFRMTTRGGFPDLFAALGDPSGQTDYALCIYAMDMSFPSAVLSVLATLPVATGPSWTAAPDGWDYRNPHANGSRRLRIRERKVGDFFGSGYWLRYAARGTDLPLPGPVDASHYFEAGIAAGIVNDIGFCALLATDYFPSLRIKKDTATRFIMVTVRPRD